MPKMFVHYSKTKAEFIAAGLATTYNNNIVFIKGDANGNGSCIYTHGTYFANFNEFIEAYVGAMNFVKGINVGGQSYNAAAGGGYVAFGAKDPSTVAVNAGSNGIEIGLTDDFVTKALKEEVYFLPTAITNGATISATEVAALVDAIGKKVVVVKYGLVGTYHVVTDIQKITGLGGNSSITLRWWQDINLLSVTIENNTCSVDKTPMATVEDVNNAKSAVIGASGDASTADTIYGAKKYAEEKAGEANEAAGAASELAQSALDRANEIGEDVGNVDTLETENKEVVKAINEVLAAVGTGGTAAVVTVTEKGATDAYAQVYEIKQGTTTVGTINIPKELVVEAGEIVENPAGQAAGTYIKLTLQNVAEPLYIDVAKLVDVYTAQQNAAQVQLNVDASNVISATIVAGSITSTELAANAVVTAKIADKNVTKDKLSDAVQSSLGKADTAYQKPADGIAKADLAEDVQNVITNAYTDSTVRTTNSKYMYISNESEAGNLYVTIDAEVKAVADATTDDKDGLASSKDVKAYVDGQWEWEEL